MKQLINLIFFTFLLSTFATTHAGIISFETVAAAEAGTQKEEGKQKDKKKTDAAEEEEPDCD